MSKYYNNVGYAELEGKIVTSISIDDYDDTIYIETTDGTIRIMHHQDCCESVNLVSYDDVSSTLNKKIVYINMDYTSGNYGENHECDESWTDSYLEIQFDDGSTFHAKWEGSSNGYYGEAPQLDWKDK